MELHLSQTDHPDRGVATNALTHDDPYFQACWSPLLAPWTAHVVKVTAELTRARAVTMSLDQFSWRLNPQPAEFRVRAMTVTRALHDMAKRGFGQVRWHSHVRAEVQLYREVPLVPEVDLARLTDPELCAHASAVADINRRQAAHGLPPLVNTPRQTERLRRADPAIRPSRPTPADAAIARLDKLVQGSAQAPSSPSL